LDAAALITLATAVVVFAAALVPLYLQLHKARADSQAAAIAAKVAARKADKAARAGAAAVKAAEEVHVMVNQQRTDAQRYTAVLLDSLRAAGLPVPPDVSLDQPA
jgi:hypothetical protein